MIQLVSIASNPSAVHLQEQSDSIIALSSDQTVDTSLIYQIFLTD